MREEELAAKAVEWMRGDDWEVFQEVTGVCGRADLVGMRGGRSRIVEVKMGLSLALLAQAESWTRYKCAHEVCVVVPAPKCRRFSGPPRSRLYALDLCRKMGVGVYYFVSARGRFDNLLSEEVPPVAMEVDNIRDISQHLAEEMKNTPAGSNRGGYWTPFRKTAKAMADHVAEHPGCSVREVVDAIEHHYSSNTSARGCLRRLAVDGHIESVRATVESRVTVFYPNEATG